jgi:hypothetical protein
VRVRVVGPSQRRLHEREPGERRRERDIVPERLRQLDRFERGAVGGDRPAHSQLQARLHVEGVRQIAVCVHVTSMLDDQTQAIPCAVVILEEDEVAREVDRKHTGLVRSLRRLPGELERLRRLARELPRPREHVAEIEVRVRGRPCQFGRTLGRCAGRQNLEPVHQSVHCATCGQDAGGSRPRQAARLGGCQLESLVELAAVEEKVRAACDGVRA